MSEEKLEKNRVVFSQRKIGGESPIVINEIIEGGLYSSFFGTLDSARIKNATDMTLRWKIGIKHLFIAMRWVRKMPRPWPWREHLRFL